MLKDMKMKDDIEAGTTHNVTVILTDQATQKPITDTSVSMKVVDPNDGCEKPNELEEICVSSEKQSDRGSHDENSSRAREL